MLMMGFVGLVGAHAEGEEGAAMKSSPSSDSSGRGDTDGEGRAAWDGSHMAGEAGAQHHYAD